MLCDCMKVFKWNLEKDGDALILGSYIPENGTYVLIDLQNGGEILEQGVLKWDKKRKELLGKNQLKYYKEIIAFDYNSKLVDMNKPIDSKKIIHSNNYFSFFIKKDSLVNGKLTEEIMENYYTILEEPIKKYKNSKKAIQLYKEVEESYGIVDKKHLRLCQKWIEHHIFSLENLKISISGKDYLKLFFLFSDPKEMIPEYIKEGNRYLLPNIYNSNDYNRVLYNEVYGLPNNNMGMNSKKPYLEHKTRGNPMPYLLNGEQVLLQKKFFDYLMNFAAEGKVNVYIDPEEKKIKAYPNGEMPETDFQGIYIRIQKGKEVEIHCMDIVSDYRFQLQKEFLLKDYLGIDISKLKGEIPLYNTTANTLYKMQDFINKIAFSKFLVTNYFTKQEDITINDPILKDVILQSREVFFSWFYKGEQENAMQVAKSSIRRLIYGAITNGYFIKAKHIFNLYYSLKQYDKKGEQDMGITPEQMKSVLREKINGKETVGFSNDNEYYFAVGQMVSYFISISRMTKKNHSLANPFIQAKQDSFIKQKLKEMYIKYNYDIASNGKRFNNMYAMISIYEPEGKVNSDMILAGYLCDNLIYEKGMKKEMEEN